MATNYVDFENGDDGTGDGTYGNPYATIGTASSGLTGGDEVRVAKHTPTALSGTLTFTNGSTSVSTSADLTGDVSAGDFVGLNDTDETWWRVSSLTSTVITLDYQYWGPGTGVASTGYLADYSQLPGDIDINASGSSTSSRLVISGGWDLTTQTQDGVSFLSNYGESFALLSWNNNNYIELSNFVFFVAQSTTYSQYSGSTYGSLTKDVHHCGYRFQVSNGTWNAWNEYQNVTQSGGTVHGIYAYTDSYISMDGVISYSAGTGTADIGFYIYASSCIRIKNISVYNSYDSNINLNNVDSVYMENITLDTNRYSNQADGLNASAARRVRINGIDISNIEDDGIYLADTCLGWTIINPVFSSIGDTELKAYSVAGWPVDLGITVKDYGGVAGDDRIYYHSTSNGYYISRDTTDARSGSCLKFSPTDATDAMLYRLGIFKVTDGGSNVTLSAYMKDDASFNGTVAMYAVTHGKMLDLPEEKTMTTSYAQYSLTVSSADIATDDYLELWVGVTGTAGAVYIDDFSASN